MPLRVPVSAGELTTLAAVLIVGVTFRDGFARALRRIGAVLLAVVGIASVTIDPSLLGNPPSLAVTFYPLGVAAVAVAYRYLARDRAYWATAWATDCGVPTSVKTAGTSLSLMSLMSCASSRAVGSPLV